MQIHEITRPLKEGTLGNIGRGFISGLTGADIPQSQASIERDAAAAAEKLRAQGYGQPAKEISVQDAVNSVKQNTQQQQYIKGLVAQWQQQAPKAGVAQESRRRSKSKSSASDANWRRDALKSVGAAFAQAPAPRARPGQMPASVAASKQGQRMLQVYGVPRGGIQDIDEAPQEYTTPGGIIIPGSTKTDNTTTVAPPSSAPPTALKAQAAAPVGNAYKDAFIKWAGENLRTSIPRTGRTITLDQLFKTDIKDELTQALDQVVATAGDPQKNAIAVNNFLTYAVAGVARESKKIKQNLGVGGAAGPISSTGTGQAIVTSQELRTKLAREAGLNVDQIDAVTKLYQDPATFRAQAKASGVRA